MKKRKKMVREKINNFNLKNQYEKSFSYLKESKNYIYFIVGVFFLFAFIGFFFNDLIIYLIKFLFGINLEEKIMNFIKNLIEQTKGLSQFELIVYIFKNNVLASFTGMILGIFFGIFSIILVIFNGYLLGFVALISVKNEGILILWRLFPHGIFELPAVLISLGLGLKLSTFIFKEEKVKMFKDYLINSLRVFLFIIIPLLIIAAIIEGILIFLV